MSDEPQAAAQSGGAGLHGAHLRTLEALFRHPTAHNLEWMDVSSLFAKIGAARQKDNDKVALEVGGEHLTLHRGHGKELTGSDVVAVRQLLQRAGWTPGGPSAKAAGGPGVAPAVAVVVIDHHFAKLYALEPGAAGSQARDIAPYDPHHFLHHLTHKDQSREEGQRSTEDPSFYRRISEALAAAPRIVVVGHGTGKSDAAQHLVAYLTRHHPETSRRVVRQLEADISALTTPQLSALVRRSLEAGAPGTHGT